MNKIIMVFFVVFITVSANANVSITCTEKNGKTGWLVQADYDNGDYRFVPDSDCYKKKIICDAIGSRSEGWYTFFTQPVRWIPPTYQLTCDSKDGQDILNSYNRDRFSCVDNIVHDVIRELIAFDSCASIHE